MDVFYLTLFSLVLVPVFEARRTCYGDIANLRPTGQQIGGVSASHRDAKADMKDLEKYKAYYDHVADTYCIQSAVVAGIASRESRGGRILIPTGGYGDHGHAWGILQCDLRTSGLRCLDCPWNSLCHIKMMVGRQLVPYIITIHGKKPNWTLAQQLQGGVAAYNFGTKNVRTWAGLDWGTTHNDYSNDVIARAQYLHANGWN